VKHGENEDVESWTVQSDVNKESDWTGWGWRNEWI